MLYFADNDTKLAIGCNMKNPADMNNANKKLEEFIENNKFVNYWQLSKKDILHIGITLIIYLFFILSLQLIPWASQYFHFSSEQEFGKYMVYSLPIAFLAAVVIVFLSDR